MDGGKENGEEKKGRKRERDEPDNLLPPRILALNHFVLFRSSRDELEGRRTISKSKKKEKKETHEMTPAESSLVGKDEDGRVEDTARVGVNQALQGRR